MGVSHYYLLNTSFVNSNRALGLLPVLLYTGRSSIMSLIHSDLNLTDYEFKFRSQQFGLSLSLAKMLCQKRFRLDRQLPNQEFVKTYMTFSFYFLPHFVVFGKT